MEKNNKLISIYGDKIVCKCEIICDYSGGDVIKCYRYAEWLHQNSRAYCGEHHELVNDINKERAKEFNKVLKEKIKNYISKLVNNNYKNDYDNYTQLIKELNVFIEMLSGDYFDV